FPFIPRFFVSILGISLWDCFLSLCIIDLSLYSMFSPWCCTICCMVSYGQCHFHFEGREVVWALVLFGFRPVCTPKLFGHRLFGLQSRFVRHCRLAHSPSSIVHCLPTSYANS